MVACRVQGSESERPAAGKRLVVIGAGNIGSKLIGLLAHMPGLSSVLLIDPDRYHAANRPGQDVTDRELNHLKVDVQGRRLRQLNRALRVTPIARAVEQVPLGLLRADAILACVDSLAARLYVNEMAFHLGVIWIDAGILADGLLARVSVFVPGVEHVCLACGVDDEALAEAEQEYPCAGGDGPGDHPAPPRTNAPSCLGAFAAALQALETHKLLSGRMEDVAAGREILLEATRHAHTVSLLVRRPDCRVQHAPWTIHALEHRVGEMTLREAFALGMPSGHDTPADAPAVPGPASPTLRLPGRRFCLTLECPRGHVREFVHVASTLRAARARCRLCGGAMAPGRHDLADRLERDTLPPSALGITLAKLGMRRGDVFSVTGPAGVRYYEVGA